MYARSVGLRVIPVADACAAVRAADHHPTLHVVYRSFGDVRPTDELLELIGEQWDRRGHKKRSLTT